jgi:hypothetical protein
MEESIRVDQLSPQRLSDIYRDLYEAARDTRQKEQEIRHLQNRYHEFDFRAVYIDKCLGKLTSQLPTRQMHLEMLLSNDNGMRHTSSRFTLNRPSHDITGNNSLRNYSFYAEKLERVDEIRQMRETNKVLS